MRVRTLYVHRPCLLVLELENQIKISFSQKETYESTLQIDIKNTNLQTLYKDWLENVVDSCSTW